MGQYKGREESETITIQVDTKNLSGYPTIIIKKSMLKEIRERLYTDIIKIRIHNHLETIYHWSIQNINKAAAITFKG